MSPTKYTYNIDLNVSNIQLKKNIKINVLEDTKAVFIFDNTRNIR